MFKRTLLILVAVIGLLPALRADEVKLKTGEVISECKVKSNKGGKVTIELLDGSRRIFREDEIDSIVEKPTIADDIEARFKKVGKKDVEGMLVLAREAKEKGAIAILKDICRQAVRADKNNEEAHLLMDEKLCADGKWRGGKTLEKYEFEQKEAEFKAKGWKKINGEWVDPVTAANLEAGLIQYEGDWLPVDHVNKLKAGKIWVEGQWYEAADQEKLSQGMRKYDGEWQKITDIDQKLKAANQPWTLESKHFLIIGSIGHKSLTTFLDHAEKLWDPMVNFFGDAPNTAKTEHKIKILVARDAAIYGVVAEANGGDDRVSIQSSNIPGYYSPKTDCVITYYHNVEYTTIWLQNGVACAFQARLFGYDKTASPAYETIASYFMGFFGGHYIMYDPMVSNGIVNWKEGIDPISTINSFDPSHKEQNPVRRESMLNRLGFVVHYLVEKKPEAVQSWLDILRRHGKSDDFKKVISEAFKEDHDKKEFEGFLNQFRASYRRPI